MLNGVAEDDEVETFFSDLADLSAMLAFEVALAEAEAAVGLIPEAAALRIAKCCAGFEPDWKALTKGVAKDGMIVPDLVRQLRAAVSAPHAEFLHFGATSQDVIDTSLMLRLKQALERLAFRLDSLIAALAAINMRDGAIPLVAHTRMQQALPFTASDKLKTWIDPLKRIRAQLDDLRPRVLVVQFGGPVGTRAGLEGRGEAIAQNLAERLGIGAAPCWHSERDRIAEIGSWLSLLSGTLGKMGQDIALMAQNEVGAIMLATGGGSSAMPHKSNPVAAEFLVAFARFNAGLLGALHQAVVHENERSGAAWTLEWVTLPQMVVATAAGLRHALELCGGLKFRARS
ncbi:3-carboxy-cis,cis-muconate cycloisomerase [Methylocella tundrae]|nr:3-carboxy-cis,cis-muconate cycloisomerase [Methylocella tundrae]WPP02940.1 3-carboxy-cis,cis-muconate cycloisomerase [Methylocella tundrae]